jgi:D-alanyl-D-alanine carboxypeptidase (penicillin-binding protein 5/6)
MKYAMRYPKLKEIIGTPAARISTEGGKTFFLKNTDKLLWTDDEVIGGKTGYTDRAKHCFVCVAEHENEMVIVALLGSPSRRNLWEEAKKLIAKGVEQITLRRFKGWKEGHKS